MPYHGNTVDSGLCCRSLAVAAPITWWLASTETLASLLQDMVFSFWAQQNPNSDYYNVPSFKEVTLKTIAYFDH